jgi:hypothetical protein
MSDLYHFNGIEPFELGDHFASIIKGYHEDAAGRGEVGRAGLPTIGHFMTEAKRHVDSLIREKRRDAASSFSTTAAFHLERDLEHKLDEVLREEYKPRNAMRLFPMDNSTPPGAQTVRGSRIYDTGLAKWHRGGNDIPRVNVSKKEQTWPVRYAVTGFSYDIFERMASNFANSNYTGELLRAAREALLDLLNETYWFGNNDLGLYGVLNYPYLPTRTLAVALDGSSSTQDILYAFLDLANFPVNNSGAKFHCNRMATSPRVRNYLFSRDRNAVSASDKSIGEVFLQRHEFIEQINSAVELQGTAPGGADYIICYRDDRKGIELRGAGGPFNVLPPQEHGLDTVVPCWAGCGGVIMRDPGNNIAGIVTPPSE